MNLNYLLLGVNLKINLDDPDITGEQMCKQQLHVFSY